MEKISQKITNRGAWVGEQIKNNDEWVCHLSRDAVSDIENALEYAKSNNVQIPFAKSDFPISIAATEINNSVEEVLKGRGYTLIRGIEIERYNQLECEMIYWGIGTHIGEPVSQNRKGHTLGHVRDQGLSTDDPDVRLYQTASRMDFHADFLPVDLLGLFCLKKAQKGGLSHVVSSLTLHNIMLEERPDLLEVAYKHFYIDWRGEEGPGELPYISVPMFSVEKGILSSRIPSRIYVHSCERFGPEFKITQKQSEVLDFVQDTANRPELRLSMTFEEGDIQLLNNHTTMHARDAYTDHSELDNKRHLLRMWLSLGDGFRRPLASSLDHLYSVVENGGIPKTSSSLDSP